MHDDPEALDRYVEDLLQDRRPPRLPLPDDEALLARQTAGMLRSAKPGSTLPSADFRQQLERDIKGWVRARPEEVGARRFTRRGMLLSGLSGIAAGVLAVLGVERVMRRSPAGPATTSAPSAAASEPPLVAAGRGRWVTVMAAAEVPDGKPVRFAAGSLEGYRLRDGAGLRAMSGVCTHMACLLNWSTLRTRFECPCHGATFEKDGTPSRPGSLLKPLPAIEFRIIEGQVEVFTA